MHNAPDNGDDIIDSRDVIARIEELEGERESLADVALSTAESLAAEIDSEGGDVEALQESADNAKEALEEWITSDEAKELAVLQALAKEGEDYSSDWRHGETLIRDSYFDTYAQELAEECGDMPRDLKWPFTHIDWEAAAKELQQDYTEIDFDGVSYWIRSC